MISTHQSMAAASASRSKSEGFVRPHVGASVDALANSDTTVRHTTRGLPRPEKPGHHSPAEPDAFPAGRYEFTFTGREDGEKRQYIFNTEGGGVSHLGEVTPGETRVPAGYLSIISDPGIANAGETRLNAAETDRLIDALYARFDAPLTDTMARAQQLAINSALAIRYNGQGAEAVAARHARY